jgi:hypothetical protein
MEWDYCTYATVKKYMQRFGLKPEKGESTWRPRHRWENKIVSTRTEIGVRVPAFIEFRIRNDCGALVYTILYTSIMFLDVIHNPVFI